MKEVNSGASCDFRKVFIDRVECMYFQALAAAIRELDGDCSMPGIIPPVRQPPTSKPPAPTVRNHITGFDGSNKGGHTRQVAPRPAPTVGEPDNDLVICPNCVHQFRAIPVNVQNDLTAAQLQIDRLKAALLWCVEVLESQRYEMDNEGNISTHVAEGKLEELQAIVANQHKEQKS